MKDLKQRFTSLVLGMTLGVVQAVPILYSGGAAAAVSNNALDKVTNFPVLSSKTASVAPMVMINTSNDHQLYYKAYNDFTDLDPEKNDGIETTYKNEIDYYGYFDSYKCYDYDTTDNRFEPKAITDDKFCDTVKGVDGGWSGNFLNWATMARIDAVRKILFGGHRRVDTATDTVLERTHLPTDAHSWAKYYKGNDIARLTPFNVSEDVGITLCNTTEDTTGVNSEVSTAPPLIRVAKGNFALWASSERWQCRWGLGNSSNVPGQSGMLASGPSPVQADDGLGSDDYTARVQACVSKALLGKESCKRYPDGNYKPIGLLQRYGETDQILFGMMSGSYKKNKSGGILVKDVGTMTDEIDKDNGTFKLVSANAQVGGVDNDTAAGIINAWSLWRIIRYRHGDGNYGAGQDAAGNWWHDDTHCSWGVSDFTDGECQNWGNPFAEIYLNSLRYFKGLQSVAAFKANDSTFLPGLNTPNSWSCPLSEENYCASLNIINFNSSVISFDADSLDGADGVSSLGSASTSTALTDAVGVGEGIHGNNYFIGEIGAATDNQLCTSKAVTSFGSVKGLCPEAPRLDGSFRIAGLAHWAHTNDLRPGETGLTGEQKVDTYSVALASSLPVIEIPVPGKADKVTILPACQNMDDDGVDFHIGNCAIVDFKIVTPHTETPAGSGTWEGKYYVNWEDTEQGGDYDQDMWGIIDYRITSDNITVTTDVISESNRFQLGFGYVISGTTQDGFHAHSGVDGYDYNDPFLGALCSDADVSLDGDGNVIVDDKGNTLHGCQVGNPATSVTYALSAATTTKNFEDPLYYASKWGGFNDLNDNDKPDLVKEWDNRDQDWVKGNPDGIPDNYFYSTNPASLELALIQVFNDILTKTASGTAAAVVASSRQGQGAIYQAMYESRRIDKNSNEVNWIGTLHAFWIDENGLMRMDDGSEPGVLEDYDQDHAINITFDETTKELIVNWLDVKADTDPPEPDPTRPNRMELENVTPLWNARERLSALDAGDIADQRDYGTSAADGRHILTWMDTSHNDVVNSSEVIDFTAAEISANNFGFLDVETEAKAKDVVNYIRGLDQDSFRSRTMNYDNRGDGTETLRLGDIINSTPTVVGPPAEAIDLLYKDSTYLNFRRQYKNRRQVIYVGANDGLLHAFNGGFFTSIVDDGKVRRKFATSSPDATATATAHPLGSELWAYAPMNLLPHLKWLTEPDYTHVYYMDAKPRVFDAKIFANDDDHPNGWGTVLVAGMRFGGLQKEGESTTVDTAGNGLGAPNNADDTEMRSAYVLMDITNPEQPPKLLAEIKHEKMGFTTSYPTAFAVRDETASLNKWYLVFGSGPTNAVSATSTQSAGLYIYDLNTKAFVTNYGPKVLVDGSSNPLANSFVGSPVSVDWDLSFKADALYFGVIGATAGDPLPPPIGKLYKMAINKAATYTGWNEPKLFFNAGNQPIMPTPTVAWDHTFNHWVYFGTGRFMVPADQKTTGAQAIYGIRDNETNTAVPVADLVDVTGVKVYSNGELDGIDLPDEIDSGNTPTFYDLEHFINTYDAPPGDGVIDHKGWFKTLPHDTTAPITIPSTRAFNTSALIGRVLFTTAYTPGEHICNAQGESDLYGLYYRTGTAHPATEILGKDTNDVQNSGDRLLDTLKLGTGLASSPSIHPGDPGDSSGGTTGDEATIITQTGVGAIEKRTARTPGKIRSGETSWREEINF